MAASLSNVADKTFDYVIAGAGPAGLTLAARLTEDPKTTVALLEAGAPNLDDPNILVPAQMGKTFMQPQYDWAFFTVPQENCNDKVSYWARGKGLGGSTAMNFYVWTKPPAADIDAFQTLGNKGWNWTAFEKYSQRSETFHPPTKDQLTLYPHTYDAKHRGTSGPVQTSIPHAVHTLDTPFMETMEKLGLRKVEESNGGDITGAWIATASLDPRTHTRSYAANAHYVPNASRPNLTVLTHAHVARVLFAAQNSAEFPNEVTATGVEFLVDGKTHVVHAKKEVILSAGTVCDPQILELSGVGQRKVLESLGVDVQVELDGVGENVQEHVNSGLTWELSDDVPHETLDKLFNPEYAAEQMKLHASQQGMYRTGITAYTYFPLATANPSGAAALYASAEEGVKKQLSATTVGKEGRKEQLDLQVKLLKDETLPDLQIIVFPGCLSQTFKPEPTKRYCFAANALNHPFSRGTIHANSTDPNKPPTINPHYFENDFDLENLVQSFKFARKMAQTEPWKSTIAKEAEPGPQCESDADIREFIKNSLSPVWHAVGACSMLPREKGGVVDSKLKVYGTANLRVVDISIIPLHISAHPQTLAYAIGEQAADIIRGRA